MCADNNDEIKTNKNKLNLALLKTLQHKAKSIINYHLEINPH